MKHLIISDVQVRPGKDYWFLEAIGNYIVDTKPDVIVCIGDFADMPSLSQYDVGMKSFEGRRYRDDILSTHKAMSTLLSPIEKEKSRLIRNKKRLYSPRMVLTYGNHECFDDQTEVLTKDGWKLIKDVREYDEVYTLAPDNRGEWQHPTGFIHKPYEGKMYTHNSRTISTSVTPKHRVVYSSNGKRFEKLAEDSPDHCDLYVSAVSGEGVDITDQQLRFIAVALTDSYHQGERLTFYQSGEKAEVIRNIIEEAGVHYVERARYRDIAPNVPKKLKQRPKIVYEFCMDRPEWCVDNNEHLPTWLFDLSERQFNLFLDVLIFCDGTIPTRGTGSKVFYGQRQICEDVQALCVTKGYRATITEYKPNQWRVNITHTTLCHVDEFLCNEEEYNGYVYCLTVPNETLMTRRNGKPSFSGNCRINKAVEKDRKLEGTLSISDLSYEEFGWEVIPFLKPVEIDGIFYSHYFCSGVMGRAFTSADRMVKALHSSCVMGHVQDAGICISQKRADGSPLLGLFTGLSTIYSEDYLNPQTNMSLRQIWELNDIRNGFAIPTAIPLDYLIKEYL